MAKELDVLKSITETYVTSGSGCKNPSDCENEIPHTPIFKSSPITPTSFTELSPGDTKSPSTKRLRLSSSLPNFALIETSVLYSGTDRSNNEVFSTHSGCDEISLHSSSCQTLSDTTEGEDVIPPDPLLDFLRSDMSIDDFDEQTLDTYREFFDSLSDTQNIYCPGCDAYIIEKNMHRKNHHSCPFYKFSNIFEIYEIYDERFTKYEEDSEKCSLCGIDAQASVVHDPSCANVQHEV